MATNERKTVVRGTNVTVIGNETRVGDETITGNVTIVGNETATGNKNITGDVDITGMLEVTGSIRTTGAIAGAGGTGNTLTSDTSFWTASGFNCSNTSNGFRFSSGGGASLTHGGNTGLNVSDTQAFTFRSTANVTTSNATPANLDVAYTPADGDIITGTAWVSAKNSATVGAGYVIHFAGRKNAGTAALIGAVATALTAEDGALSTASATVVATGGTFVVQVTGIAATTIIWTGFMQVNVANG